MSTNLSQRTAALRSAGKDLYDYWRELIPHFQPPAQQFIIWASRYGEQLVAEAIMQTAIKLTSEHRHGRELDEIGLLKYATGTMRHMNERELEGTQLFRNTARASRSKATDEEDLDGFVEEIRVEDL
jgi:hypothetical protein